MATTTTAISVGHRVTTLAHKNSAGITGIAIGGRFTSVPLGSANEISGRGPGNLKSWLPPQQVPIAYVVVNGVKTPVVIDAATWYRFLQYLVDVVLGGINAPTLAGIAADVITAKAQSTEAVIQQAAVSQQVQANAQALQATIEVAQNNSLSGSSQIPQVVRNSTQLL